MPFSLTSDSSMGKLRHKAEFALSDYARRNSFSQAAGLTPSNTTLSISITLHGTV